MYSRIFRSFPSLNNHSVRVFSRDKYITFQIHNLEKKIYIYVYLYSWCRNEIMQETLSDRRSNLICQYSLETVYGKKKSDFPHLFIRFIQISSYFTWWRSLYNQNYYQFVEISIHFYNGCWSRDIVSFQSWSFWSRVASCILICISLSHDQFCVKRFEDKRFFFSPTPFCVARNYNHMDT